MASLPLYYWSGTEVASAPEIYAWIFDMKNGFQAYDYKVNSGNGLALRSGQVTPIPEPSTLLLFGSGLVGLVGARLRKRKQQ